MLARPQGRLNRPSRPERVLQARTVRHESSPSARKIRLQSQAILNRIWTVTTAALVLLDAIHVFDGLAILFHPGANDPVTTRVKTSIGCALTEAVGILWMYSYEGTRNGLNIPCIFLSLILGIFTLNTAEDVLEDVVHVDCATTAWTSGSCSRVIRYSRSGALLLYLPAAYLATLVVLITVTGTWFGVIALRNGVERPPPFQRDL
ncbi:hypothetical protein CC2G_004439 [Coprinopsis cinerea AmutBmut pab1-1]|nr:hypothetical protein CC2G_004439 [Coprinopsis cinerea AmutBmut pab1-1]